jgi:multiple sugar transport system permease protein
MATMATTRARGIGGEKLREALVGYAFVCLPLASFLIFFIYPLIYAFYISRYEWGPLGKFNAVGAGNYTSLWHEFRNHGLFYHALKNTGFYTLVVVPCQMALGLTMAVIVNQALRARTFFRAAFYFPSLASSAAITAVALYIASSDGLLNSLISAVRGSEYHHSWYGDSGTALQSIMGLNIWTTSGTMMLFYLAALQTISTDVYEAAAIDGAGAWRTFWKITFPLLKPGHFFVLVVSTIGSLQIFDQAFIASGGTGGPNYSTETVVLYLYKTAIESAQFGYAAAVGIVLFVIIFVFTLVERLLIGKAEAA